MSAGRMIKVSHVASMRRQRKKNISFEKETNNILNILQKSSTWNSVRLSVCLNLSVSLSVCLPIHLTVCLPFIISI